MPPPDRELLQKMMDAIHHRGPDDEGMYLSGPVALGHKRLKIIDLKTGKQPISNEDGTVWIVFNGEIYNYKELRSDLLAKGHSFRTATDTEVIVHLYEEWGEEVTTRLRGMFSFALWDARERVLMLARDRVGIKPLYYCLTPDSLLFGSEVKAILTDPEVNVEVDPLALDRFLTYLYVPGEQTLFKGISKLPPGHYMVVKDGKPEVRQYWDLNFRKSRPAKHLEEYKEELSNLLAETVRDHMIADVPVGVLLSGGVDSTAVLGIASEQFGSQLSTFTIGFEGRGCTDERPYARLAAQKFGSRHYDTTITAGEFLNCLPRYVWHMEEPVCEPPAIALFYVTKLARQHVTVLLSGEGGDEAFAGYQNYRNLYWLEAIKRALGPLAGPASRLAAGLGHLQGFGRFARYAPLMTTPFGSYYFGRTADPFTLFNPLKDRLCTPEFKRAVRANTNGHAIPSQPFLSGGDHLDVLDRMLYVDTKTWLSDDLLIKADKMTMANSLELRVPLLDHRVLEFAASLPRQYKLNGWTTKYLLKQVLSRRVPKEILERKKTGFPVPYQSWTRNEFRDPFQEILTDPQSLQRGYFDKAEVEKLLRSGSTGPDRSKELFSLVVLELWHRVFIDQHVPA